MTKQLHTTLQKICEKGPPFNMKYILLRLLKLILKQFYLIPKCNFCNLFNEISKFQNNSSQLVNWERTQGSEGIRHSTTKLIKSDKRKERTLISKILGSIAIHGKMFLVTIKKSINFDG